MKRLAVLAFLGPFLGSQALADEVLLRGGGTIHGLVVEETSDKITIEIGPGRVSLPMSRVERVQGGPSALAEFRARQSALAPNDIQGLVKLGLWAKDQGLNTQAQRIFQEVVAFAPSNAVAQAALGNVRLGDRFVTQDEANRAQGLVLYEGAWMTPDERQERIVDRQQALMAAEARAQRDAADRDAQAAAQQAAADSQMQGGIPFYPGYPGYAGGYSPYLANYRNAGRRVVQPMSQPVVFARPSVVRPTVVSHPAAAPTHVASAAVRPSH